MEHLDYEVIKLALKKNHLDENETMIYLTEEEKVQALEEELRKIEDEKSAVPILEQPPPEEENTEEVESKLNLIISNKTEYFDLLFELLNLGV